MIFTVKLYVIKDHTSRNLIEVGELRGGVYCFNKSAIVNAQAHVVVCHELWHSRLRHPSSHILSMLSSELGVDSSYRANKVDVCDVCL